MNSKELERLIEDCGSLIEERSDVVLKKLAKNAKYKKKYKEFSNKYEDLVEKINKNEIETFATTIYSLNDIQNDYIYMQGFVDGILLRENLEK